MKKQRLLKLADLLEADAANKKGIKFDLHTWVANEAGNERFFNDVDVIPVNCNTQACAVGLACLSGAFKRSGLGYQVSWTGSLEPEFEGLSGWGAVEHFFGIGAADAYYLFMSDHYPRTKTKGAVAERFVAKRIRKFVENNGRS